MESGIWGDNENEDRQRLRMQLRSRGSRPQQADTPAAKLSTCWLPGGLWAAFGPPWEDTQILQAPLRTTLVRPGYLPITDATALLIAYAKGYFKDEGT